jgi:hypothetical protein
MTRSGLHLLQTRKKSSLTNGREFDKIVEAARYHYKTLTADIANAKDRQEHIRLTALANQAHTLLVDMIEFQTGLVYSHTGLTAVQQVSERAAAEKEETLDLPEFKSPYNPDA